MFEHSRQSRREGTSWTVIAGLAVFAVLLALGYALWGR